MKSKVEEQLASYDYHGSDDVAKQVDYKHYRTTS